jgi:hypothetical protein
MCDWGDWLDVEVFVPAELSHTGEARWAVKGIDSCIADIVKALTDGGVYTIGSCCGHGKELGWIALYDGRSLVITGKEYY